MTSGRHLSIEALVGVVAPEVILDAIETSQRLATLGIPHALVGGLAVGLHGHPRATKDVDFLVGEEAFETTDPILTFRRELAEVVRIGEIDLLAVPPNRRELRARLQVPESGELPVISVEALILMKLDAGRPQDIADIHHLLDQGANVASIGQFIAAHAPDAVDQLASILDEREQRKDREQ